MKRIILILGLIFLVQHANAALLLAMYQKMALIRQYNILKADSITAESGDVSMQLSCALRYWGKGDYSIARHFLSKAVKEKNDTAMVYLAEMDYYGYGLLEPDTDSALKYANQALRFGNKLSYFIIGKSLYDKQDYAKAFKCFMSVPDESPNLRLNNYYIAKCYRHGRGVQRDMKKFVHYLGKAMMDRAVGWWEVHFNRIEEARHINEIGRILEVDSNPDLAEISLLSKTELKEQTSQSNSDINDPYVDRVTKNIERVQKRFGSLIRQIEEQTQKQNN